MFADDRQSLVKRHNIADIIIKSKNILTSSSREPCKQLADGIYTLRGKSQGKNHKREAVRILEILLPNPVLSRLEKNTPR